MNRPDFLTGQDDDGSSSSNRPSPRKELQLQGPRPPSLKVNKDSYKISKKPPVVPHQNLPQSQLKQQEQQDRQPVIIYAVSPKVIHTSVTDFMNLVQRLTGNSNSNSNSNTTTSSSTNLGGPVSPAARLASIEKTSPRKTEINAENYDIMSDLLRDVGGSGSRFSGILSPAPGSLRPISPGFFSPAPGDPFNINNNMFVPSPSNLFSGPIVSPSSTDFLFSSFFDF